MEKRLLFVAPVLLILYSSLFAWSQEPGISKMVIHDEKYDAGDVEEGTVIEHTFKVTNQGDVDLKINKVRPG